MAQRVTLRKRQPYNTTSNRRRVVKTPGGVLVYHHIKKLATAPKCGDCGCKLAGVRLIVSLLIIAELNSDEYGMICVLDRGGLAVDSGWIWWMVGDMGWNWVRDDWSG